METNRKPLRGHLVVLNLFFLFVIVAASGIYYRGVLNDRLPVLGEVAPFDFTQSSGSPFRQADLRERVNVIDFIFTNCSGPCPVMSGKMADLYREFSDDPRVQFISVTVDPERDSLSVLQAYAKRFGADDDRWVFLRAPIPDVNLLAEKSFMLGGELPSLHSTKFILVDGDARIRGYFNSEDSLSINELRRQIRKLTGEKK